MAHTVTHDGDPRLAAHLANCVTKATTHGDLITKDRRNSPRKIDAAVGAIPRVRPDSRRRQAGEETHRRRSASEETA